MIDLIVNTDCDNKLKWSIKELIGKDISIVTIHTLVSSLRDRSIKRLTS